MTVSDVASLIAAIAFVLLVGFLALPLIKLGRVFDEARSSLKELTDHSIPILDEATSTVAETNAQLGKIDTITTSAAQVSENISALTGLYTSVLGTPLIKVASAAYGVQHAAARAFSRFKGASPDDDGSVAPHDYGAAAAAASVKPARAAAPSAGVSPGAAKMAAARSASEQGAPTPPAQGPRLRDGDGWAHRPRRASGTSRAGHTAPTATKDLPGDATPESDLT